MVALNTNKLSRVSTQRAESNFQSSATPAGAFGVKDRVRPGVQKASGVGQAISGLGEEFGKLALQMQAEDNETEAKAADARIAQRIRDITIGDPNTPGYFSSRGKNSLDSFGGTEEALRQVVQEEVDKAKGNSTLSGMIQSSANLRLNPALDKMSGHASEQRLQHQQQTSESRIAQAHADVAANYGDDQTLAQSLSIATGEALDQAEANGLSSEASEVLVSQKQSVIVKGAFDAALTGQDTRRAQAIFSQNAERLDGPTRQVMAQALSQDVQAEAAQDLAAEALALHPGDRAAARQFIDDAVNGKQQSATMVELNSRFSEQDNDLTARRESARFAEWMRKAQRERVIDNRDLTAQNGMEAMELALPGGSITEQVALARKTYSGQEESDVVALIVGGARIAEIDVTQARAKEAEDRSLASEARAIENAEAAKRERELKAQRAQSRGDAVTFLQGNPNMAALQRENPQLFDEISQSGDYANLQVYARGVARGEKFAASTDGKTMLGLEKMGKQELIDTNLPALAPKLTEGEYRRAERLMGGAVASLKRDEESRTVYTAGEAAVEKLLPEMFKGKRQTDAVIGQISAVNREMEAWITDYRKNNSKTPPQTDINKKAVELMTPIVSDTWGSSDDWHGVRGAAALMTADQQAIVTVDFEKIPPFAKATITRTLTAEFPSVHVGGISESEWEELAGAYLMRDDSRFRALVDDL